MWTLRESVELYGISRWGLGYYDVNKAGHLVVKPRKDEGPAIDIMALVDRMSKKGLKPPVLFRFPQILEDRVKRIHECFQKAIVEFHYPGEYRYVYPMKVNQTRGVVEQILSAGKRFQTGLEVGSKAELITSLALPRAKGALLICNGFKDDAYLRLAFDEQALRGSVIIVIDDLDEVPRILKLAKTSKHVPDIGLRAKLFTKGSGKWASSSGEQSKFGLMPDEMLTAIHLLQGAKLADRITMLHFHAGSQITDVDRIQDALREGSRLYIALRKMGVPIRYLNVGGGLGVDYDGSRTSSDSSVNYGMQEYANNVVYTVGNLCEKEEIPVPTIVSESGRAVTAYHSVVVFDVLPEKIPADQLLRLERAKKDPHILEEMYECLDGISAKNYREYYHDSLKDREELHNLFALGQIGFEDRAKGEFIFRSICRAAYRFAAQSSQPLAEFDELKKVLARRYMGNFSVFQSIPDSWAIEQLFPVVPIHRLNEAPEEFGVIADLTCDSDGTIDEFIDVKNIKRTLELHAPRNGIPYYLAICLLGAYQDTIGDYHNLFGILNDIMVSVDEKGQEHIERIRKGDSAADVIAIVGYPKEDLLQQQRAIVEKAVQEGRIPAKRQKEVLERYRLALEGYTYLVLD